MKRVLEVRCADAVPVPLLGSVPALWKGILYDADARAAAGALAKWTPARARRRTPRCGAARSRRRDAERSDARAGARARGHRAARSRAPGSRPTRPRLVCSIRSTNCIERGKSPGEIVLERWQGEWAGSPGSLDRFHAVLIECGPASRGAARRATWRRTSRSPSRSKRATSPTSASCSARRARPRPSRIRPTSSRPSTR